jgi:hypothetical protein
LPLLQFFLFICVFEAMFKIKISRVSLSFFLHKLYVLLGLTCFICMDFIDHYVFFDLYGLFIFLDDLYGVFSGFNSSRYKI